MALKISLRPNERLIIGGAVITNGPNKSEFIVENKVPLLRQDSILSMEEADSPARRIYFTIQLMYIDADNIAEHQKLYWELVRDFVKAAPSFLELIDHINELISKDKYYQALKVARKLIDFEQEVLERAKQCC
ncbi:MAG: flagellar biosynthesis repressor FlbT [Desulfosarcinaceae bacterium]